MFTLTAGQVQEWLELLVSIALETILPTLFPPSIEITIDRSSIVPEAPGNRCKVFAEFNANGVTGSCVCAYAENPGMARGTIIFDEELHADDFSGSVARRHEFTFAEP